MNIIVHYPQTSEKKQELSNRVAEVHAKAVIEILKANVNHKEDALKLINAICSRGM